jgi:SlyX protein
LTLEPAENQTDMTDDDTKTRLESLETRIMHQDATIDELTRTLLRQEQLMSKHVKAIKHLEEQIRGLTDSNPGMAADEPPPPHY